jgi:hypothetical protein
MPTPSMITKSAIGRIHCVMKLVCITVSMAAKKRGYILCQSLRHEQSNPIKLQQSPTTSGLDAHTHIYCG